MTANVALTDTFDQWRVKDNEIIIMTQPSGMNNFIKVLDTANSTTTTTGSIITHGGIGIGKSVHIGEDLKVWGDITCVGDTTVHGNLVFGDATSDQVTFEADINSDVIPNTTLTFDLGNTTQFWANTYTGHIHASQKVDSGLPAILVDALDVYKIAVDINASTETANAVDISADAITSGTAFKLSAGAITSGIMMDLVSAATITGTGLNIALDSLTTGKIANISGDGLTTGSCLYIESNSADASARHLLSVINENDAADGAIPIYARQDGDAPCAQFAGTTSCVVPAGTSAQRGTGVQGGIRFNNEYSFFEGYTGSSWTQMGQLEDVDEDTHVRAETSPGTDNDELTFTTAGALRLTIGSTGDATFTGTIFENSMRELKTNIENVENVLPSILQMQGVKFDWKDESKTQNRNYGFIAEDVDKILPDLVAHDKEGKPKAIQYTKLTAVLLEAIKEQQDQINDLKLKIGV